MQSVNDIRTGFLDFFRRNGHDVRPAGSLVPHNDPTLMFTNAGMNQFKNIFTGAEKVPYKRAATAQKCVRAGGKHNDLDNVGYTARHHTFFEMLGNFSFGDYFKEEAIRLAWDLLTKDYGIDPKKLTVTVYHTDDEAYDIWSRIIGSSKHRIIRIPTNDNFWSMGDTGPCGPCSEIFYDHGENIPGGPPGSPDADGDRFVEIWNLVFMQYEQLEGGKRIDLPKPSIDTGMGLERISAVLQGVHDNYDIDLFQHLIAEIKTQATIQTTILGGVEGEPAAYKVIADHLRASCFLMADGVMPSNEGRGYVLRRIMRRAMRYAHQLGCKEPLMYKLVPALVKEMGEAYPELKRAEATITSNLKEEEERFKETLERGLKLLSEAILKLDFMHKGQAIPQKFKLPGDVAFKLYDTYGFPLDLTQDILRSRDYEVDIDWFEKEMEKQRNMARAAHKGSGDTATGKIWFELKEKLGTTEFLGYDVDEVKDAKVLAIVKNGESVQNADEGEISIILDKTPFYGESGGQVGDAGRLYLSAHKENDPHFIEVSDTQKPLDDFFVHKVNLNKTHIPTSKKVSIKVGDKVKAEIYIDRRNAIRANHSATHLLHKALRDQLGEHVTQKGSLVDAQRLRFDFSHPKAVTREELAVIEHKVNEVVAHNTPVACKIMSPDEAIKEGAMALFGEKYGDKVRVLSMGTSSRGPRSGSTGSRAVDKDPAQSLRDSQDDAPYSIELCGGTHVRATGDIGLFKITSEGSVASGIRRIEAVTGEGVREYCIRELWKLQEQFTKLQADGVALYGELSETRKKLPNTQPLPPYSMLTIAASPADLERAPAKDLFTLYKTLSAQTQSGIAQLQEDNKRLSKALADAKKQQALGASGEVKPEKIGDINFIGKSFEGLDPKELRPVAENYLKQADVVAVASNVEGRASIVIAVSQALTQKISAVTLVQAAVAELGGKGGGGRPEMAQGGGPEADKITHALDAIRKILH